jgi:type I restriction enzyme M protein
MGVKDKVISMRLTGSRTDTKGGAEQSLPRPLIKAMVECLRPEPQKRYESSLWYWRIFLAAYDWMVDSRDLDKAKQFLKYRTFSGMKLYEYKTIGVNFTQYW